MGVPTEWGGVTAVDGSAATLSWRLAARRGCPGAKRGRFPPGLRASLVERLSQGGPARTLALTGSAAVLVAEVMGSVVMWAVLPLAWIWIAARVFQASDSLAAAGAVALVGLAVSEALAVKALVRVDAFWVVLRRRAGHDQRQGALTRVVVICATLGLAGFLVWYYLLSHAYIIPFMPSS